MTGVVTYLTHDVVGKTGRTDVGFLMDGDVAVCGGYALVFENPGEVAGDDTLVLVKFLDFVVTFKLVTKLAGIIFLV